MNTCQHCSRPFIGSTRAKWCSSRCRNDAYMERRRIRKEAARHKECVHCGEPFVAQRVDAKYCTNMCRQRSYRWRVTVAGWGV